MEPKQQAQKQATERLSKQQGRIRIVFLGIVFCFILLTIRSIQLQVLEHNKLDNLAYTKNKQLKSIPVQKGTIYTQDGQILAASLPSHSIYLDASEVEDATAVKQLFEKIEVDPLNFSFSPENRFQWVKRNIKQAEKDLLESTNLKGVNLARDFQRIYPSQNNLSAVLGFSGQDSAGLEGLEFQFHDYLISNQTFAQWYDKVYQTNISSTTGGHLVLSIDDKIQSILEEQVRQYTAGTDAMQSLSLVMQTKTGAILGAASHPSYNPNFFQLYNPQLLKNSFIGGIYEPGSTFKIITLSIALDENWIDPDIQLDCGLGKKNFFGQTINDTTPLGYADLALVIQKSSNICAAQVGLKIPSQNFYQGIQRFGFLQKSGIEMPGESEGSLRNYLQWKKIDQAILSYGHGIAVTPLQMLSAVNVIANDGIYVQPYLIQSKIDGLNQILEQKKRNTHRVISSDTAQQVKGFMEKVVSPQGTGRLAMIDGLTVAGKTGTTKKYDIKKKQYSSDDVISSFVGFFPAEEPLYTILTLINNPRQKFQGSMSAAALFKSVSQKIWYLQQNFVLANDPLWEQPSNLQQYATDIPQQSNKSQKTQRPLWRDRFLKQAQNQEKTVIP